MGPAHAPLRPPWGVRQAVEASKKQAVGAPTQALAHRMRQSLQPPSEVSCRNHNRMTYVDQRFTCVGYRRCGDVKHPKVAQVTRPDVDVPHFSCFSTSCLAPAPRPSRRRRAHAECAFPALRHGDADPAGRRARPAIAICLHRVFVAGAGTAGTHVQEGSWPPRVGRTYVQLKGCSVLLGRAKHCIVDDRQCHWSGTRTTQEDVHRLRLQSQGFKARPEGVFK